MSPDGITLTAALVAGLAGSGHCLAMCGGLAAAAGLHRPRDGAGRGWFPVVVLQLSRVASYGAAGAVAGAIGQTVVGRLPVATVGAWLRVATALLMFAVAWRLLFGRSPLDRLERAGASLWRRVVPPMARLAATRRGLPRALLLGLGWGALPCGLSYSMLLLSAATGTPGRGALLMLLFGLGTLPALMPASLAFPGAAGRLRALATPRAAGIVLTACGVWSLGAAVEHLSPARHAAHTAGSPAFPAGHEQRHH